MRPALRSVIVAALVTSLAALPGAALSSPQHFAVAQARVTLKAEAGAVAIGNKAVLKGDAPVGRGATVTIWQMQVATGRWGVEGTARTGRGGAFRYSEVVHRGDRVYKACVRVNSRTLCSRGERVNVVKPRSYTITADPSAASYQAGQEVVVSGVVKPNAVGDAVRLERAPWATDAPGTVVARGKVGKGGVVSLKATAVAGDWAYRVVKPKTAVGKVAKSTWRRVQVSKAPVILAVAGVTPTSLEAGQPVTVTGAASGNLVGQTVYLQAYDTGTSAWGSVGSAVVDGSGHWLISAPLLQAGKAVQLQVIAPETAGTAPGAIAAGSVAVYGWYYFWAEGSPLDEVAGDWWQDSAAINGAVYPKSIGFDDGGAGFGEANLSRSCTTFAAVVGLDDHSSTASRASLRIYADSLQVYSRDNVALGQSYPITLSIANALRLRIESQFTTLGSTDSDTTLGDARALCAF